MTFQIRTFDDYHEIQSETWKTIELGCFPQKGYDYGRYFGLFYKGQKPYVSCVMERLKRKVDFNISLPFLDRITPTIFLQEVEEAMKR